ncbi:hypothetical protein [Streptomyces sp. NPDC007088]|uniref:hypothetical protein n=1 Tax=Streptomyces sp. NPDC007088 TaxID=3364773 RepID=UPI003679928C
MKNRPVETHELHAALEAEKAAARAERASGSYFGLERARRVLNIARIARGGSAAAHLLGVRPATVSVTLARYRRATGRDQTLPGASLLGVPDADRYELSEQSGAAVHSRDIPVLAGTDFSRSMLSLYSTKLRQSPPVYEEPVQADGSPHEEWERRLVPAVIARAAELLPDYEVAPTGLWAHKDRDWQWASPDRLLTRTDTGATGLLLCQVSSEPISATEGGPGGPRRVPDSLAATAQWDMDTLGLTHAYIATLHQGHVFRLYHLTYEPSRAGELRQAAEDLLAAVRDRREPDEHDRHFTKEEQSAIAAAARRMLPEIEEQADEVVEYGFNAQEDMDRYRTVREIAEAAERGSSSDLSQVLTRSGLPMQHFLPSR